MFFISSFSDLYYILQWLDSPNKDLLLITTGVLINMMEEKEARQFLMFSKGMEKLVTYLFILRKIIKPNLKIGNGLNAAIELTAFRNAAMPKEMYMENLWN